MALKFGSTEWSAFVVSILLLTDLAILLNIPFLRQVLGFFFLTLLPGILILQILKLNKTGSTEKFVLSVGLSISFLMFFGLLINNSLLCFGYETPLATIPLLISFNIAIITLVPVGYKINKNALFSLPEINLTVSEKAFLIVPILFPALSIFGIHVMNTTDNNVVLIFLLFLIPIYVAFVCFSNQKFPKRLYPVVIFLISISLLLLLSLRSNHIIGVDIHAEYYFFRTTLDNLHWSISGRSALDACLVISLLPTIYQSILNIPPEFLFKILYSVLYSISPLVIYVLSKKYIGESYAFLASCFFMFQLIFLWTAYYSRTNIAILFFALAMMTLFDVKIDPLKKRILFIVFMVSCVVSHYSTTYIFFFIMLGTFIGVEILSKKYNLKKIVSFTMVILLFSLIFFWYSQVTEAAFNCGIGFIEETFTNLNKFFVEESRSWGTEAVLGKDIGQKSIIPKIEFVFTWLTFIVVGIGVITLIRRYKEMSFPELNFKKSDFLKDKFEVTYFMFALACSGLLVVMVVLPYVSAGYGMERLYGLTITILSVFFVIGGVMIAKTLSLNLLRKVLSKTLRGKKALSKKQKENRTQSEVQAYLVILLILIPYFFCVTGVMYDIFGVPRVLTLNSEGEQYDILYIHDQDIIAARWMGDHNRESQKDLKIYTDVGGSRRISLAYDVNKRPRTCGFFKKNKPVDDGYIYLWYTNVVVGKVYPRVDEAVNITEYSPLFDENIKIYGNGGSEVWR
ncbi:MAG: DUF2206 domain-containing protein [Methanophagales archaeon]|nr:DUF2206 domain-containing protein [Methanophagales archaeon]